MNASDRVGVPIWLWCALIAATGLALGSGVAGAAARGGHSPTTGALIGVLVATLGIVGLPSLSLRFVPRVLVLVGGGLLVRYSVLRSSLLDSGQVVIAWTIGAVLVLVLTDQLGAGAGADAGADQHAARPPVRPASVARSAVGVILLLLVAMALLAPLAVQHLGQTTAPGEGPRSDQAAGQQNPLRASDSLDMTRRPELSDAVVLTIESPEAAFWRGQTYDRWDGRTWRRSDPRLIPVLPGENVLASSEDLAAGGGTEVRQRVRVQAPYAELLVAQASPVRVSSARTVLQGGDGTLSAAGEPMGRGATYTVVSRRFRLTPNGLRASAADPVPTEVAARYAAPPTTTARVREAARAVTASAPTPYDKILALERWMGGRTEYSLDAPLSPPGVDVVDHFLFTSRRGWCEQVASSLVVLARSVGIPARLATGYVADERDRVTGSFVVRERDAHAWAEVWFPRVGWVTFDPTADLALAGSTTSQPTLAEWLLGHAMQIVLALVAVALVVGPIGRWVRRRWVARPVRGGVPSWGAVADRQLGTLGERVGRRRLPAESATAYASALAERYQDQRLAEVGVAVDATVCAPDPTPAEERDRLDAVLAELAAVEEPAPAG